MKKSAQKGNTFLIILICAAIIIGAAIFFSNSLQSNKPLNFPTPTPSTTKFQSSSTLDFAIQVPTALNVQEKLGQVIITNGNEQIFIGKSGSNFSTLKQYVDVLNERNRVSMLNKKSFQLHGLNYIKGNINGEMVYFIQVPNIVYILSTKSPKLYSSLDQIAKSFRYTP
jgi:hypothetical protein